MRPTPPAAPRAGEPWASEILDALLASGLEIDGRPIGRDALLDLPLPVFHALRWFVERLVPDREPAEYSCRNCDGLLEVDPFAVVPESHFVDRLGSDEPIVEREFVLPEPVWTGDGEHSTLTVKGVTVREVMPLWEALTRARGWDVTAPVVRAMGVVALGTDRHAARIARALSRASDDVWNTVSAAFDEMAYPASLTVPVFCQECEARNDLLVPPDRELHVEPPAPPATDEKFPDEEEFAATVERVGARVYGRRGIRNVVLVADAGTPPCDEGGEPLMGSYQVLHPDDLALRPRMTFEISLFYKSFERMWVEEGPYDVEAEIEETIDHEVEHHLGHLAGKDVQDEEEVDEIRRDLVDTYGRKALLAGLFSDFARDFGRFARAVWPFLLIGAVVIGVGLCATR